MKRFFLLFATFVACIGSQAQVTYTTIANFESGSTSASVLWSGAAAVVNNTTGSSAAGSKVLQVTDTEGYPFLNIPVSFESGKSWTDYDGIEMDIYPIDDQSGSGGGSKAVGLDLSLLKAYEDAGVTYKDASGATISNVMTWVKQQKGVNYIRLRLFVDPSSSYAAVIAGGSSYLNQLGGDLATVKILGKRVKDAGMKLLLDIQYSDGWADPAKQVMPYRWASKCNTQAKLQDSVYQYTKNVLNAMVNYGAAPDMVQIGNEVTYGMFFTNYGSPTSNYTNSGTISFSSTSAGKAGIHCHVNYWNNESYVSDTYWTNLANVIKKGCQAVREVCPSAKIMLHTERSAATGKVSASGYTSYTPAQMFYKKMQEKSVDYDVIGLSYYAEDHGTIASLSSVLSGLVGTFPTKEIMLAEYGYSTNWARGSYAPSTIGYYRRDNSSYSCPLAQKEFISALITELKKYSTVTGMFYWFAEENESTSSGPYGNGWRNSGLWANETNSYASNKTNTAYSQTAGCAVPAFDVLADFQDASSVSAKDPYYAQAWLKFYDADGAANWLHKKVGLNTDDPYGISYLDNGLDTWYTVRFGFNTDSITAYIAAVGSAPASINLEHINYTNYPEASSFYVDNIRFYQNPSGSYALDFEDGTVNQPSSVVHDGYCSGSQKVASNPNKSGINTSNKVMTVTNTWVQDCDLYKWYVDLPSDLSLYDSIYMDIYPVSTDTWITMEFNDGGNTRLLDGADYRSWSANTWHRLGVSLSSLSGTPATRMYFGMWASGYSVDNITFHAKPPVTYTVSFNANGHGTAPANQTVVSGAKATEPAAPTETGYTFGGWYKEATCTNQWNFSTDVVQGNTVLYAKWTPNTNTAYTVRHMWQNIDDDGYTLHESESKTGTTGSNTAAASKTYMGFTAKSFNQSIIAANGSTVVDIYYDRKTYTITWKDGDNNTIETDLNVKYGAMPSYNGSTPTKTATAQYTYTFNNTWSPAIAEVTGNQTYVAQFDQTVNEYTITWKNDDGTVIDHTTVAYGVTPSHAAVSKAATAQYTYTFVGWTPTIVPVTGDAEYTAVFTAATNTYTITWLNEDGSLIDETTVAYGVTPTHADATKAATAQYTYTFSGWSPAIAPVTGNATYTATFTSMVNEYTITWKNDDGTVIDETTVAYGVTPTHADATKASTAQYTYTFSGWSPAIAPVTGDATYTATFTSTVNEYTITWKNDDGTVIDHTTVAYGATPSHAAVSKAATAQYTYTFVGWTPTIVPVTGDAEYTAVFSAATNSYMVSFHANGHGTDPDAQTVAYGAKATQPTISSVDGYTFGGWYTEAACTTPWDFAANTVTGNVDLYALWTLNSWMLTWDMAGGTITTAGTPDGLTAYGTALTAPEVALTGYEFAGWSPAVPASMPDHDATYTATWSAAGDTKYTVRHLWQNIDDDEYTEHESEEKHGATGSQTAAVANTYTGFTALAITQQTIAADGTTVVEVKYNRKTFEIQFVVDEIAVQTDNLRYGATPVPPANPVKDGDDQYTYTFDRWTPEIVTVTSDAVYTALFTSTVNTYLVEFYNWNSVLLQTGEWEYGTTPVYSGPAITREDDHQYTYTFAGWDPQIEPVIGEAFYFATFSSQLRTFSANDVVTSNDPDMGSVAISPQQNEYEYGEQITVTATPQQGYVFSGWQNEDDEIISTDATTTISVTDSTLTAIFVPNPHMKYVVSHWLEKPEGGFNCDYSDTLYGTTGNWTEAEAKTLTGFYAQSFDQKRIGADGLTEVKIYYYRYQYEIKFIVDGEVMQASKWRYGAMPEYNGTPTKQGDAQYTYTFAGWDPEVVTVTADATYRAVFTQSVNSYTVTFHANGHATDPEPASVEYGHIVNCTTLYADDGWIFDGWFREAGCQTPWDCLQDVVTADIDLYAKWIPSENMFYWVIYRQQNIDDDEYTVVESEQKQGTTGQLTEAVAKDYTGFVMKPFSQVPIAPNTEVNIYYDRLRYEVNFVVEGVAVQTDSVRYYGSAEYRGETPTKPETEQFYYTFWCWDKATNMPIVADVTFTALFNEYSKGGGTGLEQVVITESGISGPKGMRIYDYTGKDVTSLKDNLYNGTYIIVVDGKTRKVAVNIK